MPDEAAYSEEIQLLVFSIANEEFACRTDQVIEITKMMEIVNMPKSPTFIKGVINLRGKVIAVIDLADQLDLPPSEHSEDNRIIVAEVDDNMVGMLVHSTSEVLTISTENIEPTPAVIEDTIDTRYIQGIGRIGDRIFVILDFTKVLSSEEMEGLDKTTGA